MGKSKYWNWCGNDPMPEVAERYYDLLEEVNNSFPDEMWDADKVPGVESGRYEGYVSVYHICHDGPEDIHLDIDKDDNGKCTVALCSLRDNGAKNFWDFPKRVFMKYRVPYKVLMDRDFAFNILVLFAGSKKGYRKEMAKFITKYGGKPTK
jgi:hypothetical protein